MTGRRTPAPSPAGEQAPKRMRQAGLGGSESLCTRGDGRSPEVLPSGGVEKGSSLSAPAAMVVHDLTVVDNDVLDCGVCFHPLKPPIFQCAVGHALCTSCLKKLKNTRRCHVCRVAMPSSYQRCHVLERVVDSIVGGPCPHVPYGCDGAVRLVYHARAEHIRRCPHAPCYCPGEGCGFVGSVTTLVEHLVAAPHRWPCTAEPIAGDSFGVDLRHGFNFLTAVRGGAKYLLLLDMASIPFMHMISAVWIRSVPAVAGTSSAPPATCELELRIRDMRSRFPLQCTTPLNSLPPPDPKASFNRFFFPDYLGGSDKAQTVHVKAVISIKSS